MTESEPALLSVKDLKVTFPGPGNWFGRAPAVRAVDGVSLKLMSSEILGLVGESGCGKTTLAHSLVRLVEPDAGQIVFDDIDVLALSGSGLKALRKRMQIVFQNPYSSLNPKMTVTEILSEPLVAFKKLKRKEVRGYTGELLNRVGLNTEIADRYPHEMSGGQRQRVAIARALSLDPELLIADEPVSSLDVSVQAHILRLLDDLRRRQNIAILFVSHDLAVVEKIADRTAVMYQGRILEQGETEKILRRPSHAYSKRLLEAARASALKLDRDG